MRFSVIIPLFNKASYVAKAIGSVLAQTFSDFELVIVDDGSTDGSVSVATDALRGDPRCRIIHQQNAGVSVARNNGVAASSGDYLCFLDADDWWEPAFLEEMDGLVKEFPEAGIYGTNYTIVNETRHKTRVAKIGVEDGFHTGYINYFKVYADTMYMPLWTGAVCIPRMVFEEMGGFPKGIKLGEDFLLWIRIVLRYKVAFLNRPLAFYNQDVDVASRSVGRLHKPQENMLWNLDFLTETEKSDAELKQLIDNLRAYSLMPYLLDGRYRDAARKELEKVDWSNQPEKARRLYQSPIWYLQVRQAFLAVGSKMKLILK